MNTPQRLPRLALAALSLALLTSGGCPADDAASADTLGGDTASVDVAVDPDASDATGDATADAGDVVAATPEEGLAAAIAALCPGYAARYCAETERCGCTAAPGFPTACTVSFEAACAAQLTSFLEVVRSGEAVYRPENAATCFAALVPVYDACLLLPNDLFFFVCPILTPPGGFTDLPGEGDACDGSCAPPLRCTSAGRCATPGTAAAPCDSAYACDPTLVCADDICQAPRHADLGQACTGPEGCSGDTTCIASVRKVCRPPVAAGPCRYDDDCPAHAFCAPDAGGGELGTCTPGGAAGEPCGSGVVCAAGLACGLDSALCGPVPTTGEACALGPFGPFVCADGLSCLDGTCGAPPAEGQTCAMGPPHCADGLGCAFEETDSVCRPRRVAGGECQNDGTCADGFFCNFGENRCEAARALGALCSDGNECGVDGACLPDDVFTFRCAPRPADGGVCFLDECQDGLICRTPYTEGVCAPVLCQALHF